MKKQSAAKLSPKPRNSVTFFLDRNLGRADIPNRLRDLGCNCILHDNRFPQVTPDSVWLSALKETQWIVLTKDERIRYRPLELKALREAELRVFVLVAGSLRGSEIADVLVSAIDKIIEAAGKNPGPCLYYVYKNGSIRLIC